MSETQQTPHLVVVGASAGGIEALSVLVGSIKKDFPAPIVLAQHLDPSRPSQLAGILERRSELPIVLVGEDTPLQAGRVYVVPSNRHVVIRDGHVGLDQDHADRPRPSVDLLLSSAAKSYGERLIAVILTGSGSDGACGAVEVKEAGGIVVIQNPETAAHPSMPQALPPTAVDHIADLQHIGPLLTDLLTGVTLPHRLDGPHQDALTDIMNRVTRQAAIDFNQYKPATVLRRVSRRMAVTHTRTLDEYRGYLDTHPQEIADLTKSLLIKVTQFFRDAEAFRYLEQDVMPGLLDKGRERGRVLRLWSAGCATGEEPYSLALIVSRMLGADLPDWNVKIFATDVDHDAIAFARRGLYPRNVLESIEEHYRGGFTEPAEHGVRIHKALRQMVIFGQQDLSRGVPFPRIDLVLCRNLLIYFKPELQQEVLDLFAYSLHQTQGCLFLGKAETARPSKAVFELVDKKWKVYRCVSGPLPIAPRPPALTPAAAAMSVVKAHATAPGDTTPAPEPRRVEAEWAQLRRANELLLRQLPVGVVLIDRTYRIFSLNGAARRLLGMREVAIDTDFLHSSRGLPYQDVRSAIDRVFRERSSSTLEGIELGPGGLAEGAFVSLSIVPLHGQDGAVDFALITIADVTESMTTRQRLIELEQEQKVVSDELNAANRRLTEMNKEFQDANEELQAANEEMMLAQEELQATNEEFEATNEELQATNEELETNNEELQATNEELETTNEELQARTSELQDLTRVLSSERLQLSAMVQLAPFSTLVLRGPRLEIASASESESQSQSIALIFGASFEDMQGRPFDEVVTDPRLLPVREGVRQSYESGKSWTSTRIELGVGSRKWFVFTAVPSGGEPGHNDTVVLYAEDVTTRRLLEEAVRTDKLKIMLDRVDQVAMALFDAADGRLIHGTVRYLSMVERLLGVDKAQPGHLGWRDLWFGPTQDLENFDRVRSTGQPVRLPELAVGKAPERSIWDCTLIPISAEDDSNHVVQIVLSAIEVTESASRREDLERLDRLKDEFLSLASHELRTPLAPLMTYTEILTRMLAQENRGSDWDRQIRDIVESFRRQVAHMSRLTDDLLDVSRLQSGKFRLQMQPTRVRSIIDDAIEQSKGDGRPPIRVTFESDDDLWVNADGMRATQVIHNFVANALRHAPKSGPIDLKVRRVENDGMPWARIEVRDRGPGVPEAVRDRLFSRYFQTEPARDHQTSRGLGLGLFIARQIIEQHGGRIGADFEGGSTFWVELPQLQRVPAPVPAR